MSNMAMLTLLRRMGRADLTVHGFRSAFRDWAAEAANFPSEVAEMALAHAISNEVEAAYRRGDLFEKRRQLMSAWGRYCDKAAPAKGEENIVSGCWSMSMPSSISTCAKRNNNDTGEYDDAD